MIQVKEYGKTDVFLKNKISYLINFPSLSKGYNNIKIFNHYQNESMHVLKKYLNTATKMLLDVAFSVRCSL